MGHTASECWQGYVQAVEEVPSSSASSVAPSAATIPATAKTAASIQEFNDDQEPGLIFGVMGGSVASVTTGTDDLWDELVLDSGSVSTACPYAWCSDISVNNEDKVYLQVTTGTDDLWDELVLDSGFSVDGSNGRAH